MADNDDPIIGFGKELAYSDTLNGSYTPIPKTIDIQLPTRELGEAETTNDDSPDYHKEFLPALYDPGTVPFTYRYTAAAFTIVESLFMLASVAATRESARKYFRVTLPDGSIARFLGYISKNDLPVELEGSPVVEAEIRVSGKITWNAAQTAS